MYVRCIVLFTMTVDVDQAIFYNVSEMYCIIHNDSGFWPGLGIF